MVLGQAGFFEEGMGQDGGEGERRSGRTCAAIARGGCGWRRRTTIGIRGGRDTGEFGIADCSFFSKIHLILATVSFTSQIHRPFPENNMETSLTMI